jgi:chromosome segregation ATPase
MSKKTNLLSLTTLLALALMGTALAGSRNDKTLLNINKGTKAPKASNPAKSGNKTWSQEKGACHSLDSRSKELLAQEKQLHQQAKAKEAQERSLRKEAKAIEAQRESIEHSRHRGVTNVGTNEQARADEQRRVELEHQADAISKEREQLERQANEIGKERRSLEAQHKQECAHGGHAKIS